MNHNTDIKEGISVVIPCYNAAKTIERAISSILNQKLLPDEIILVDDKSVDDTLSKLKEIQARYETGFITVIFLEENSGPSIARNRGWEKSQFTFIAFLDSDDTWHVDKLLLQHKIMFNDRSIAISGHKCSPYKENNISRNIPIYDVAKTDILLSNVFMTTSTIMIKSTIKETFMEHKNYAEDYLFILDIIFNENRAVKIDLVLTYQYKEAYGSSGLSSHIHLMEKGELEVYLYLYKKNKISLLTVIFVTSYSILKYLRRLMIVSYRKLKKRNIEKN